EDSGAKMQVFMDGQELPAVSSEEGRPSISADIDSMVGFGNEVNPEGQDRGFNGSISKVVLTQFEGSFDESFLKTMVLSDIEQRLLMYGLGNLDESQYDISEDEDRKSTRLNSSHVSISYAVFCLNKSAHYNLYTLSLHDALPILNPEGQDRGFNGSISKVVLTQFEGSFDESFLKTMVLSDIEQRLLMYGLGNLDESQYDISED